MEKGNSEKATRDSFKDLKLMSNKKTQLSLNRDFSKAEFQKISFGLIPLSMDDKWFIFLEDNILYFHRSWTGECIYQVRFSTQDTKYIPKEVWVCRDFKKYKFTTDKYDVKLLLFLIENLLLGKNTPFPLPFSLEKVFSKGAVQHSFSGIGFKEEVIDED